LFLAVFIRSGPKFVFVFGKEKPIFLFFGVLFCDTSAKIWGNSADKLRMPKSAAYSAAE